MQEAEARRTDTHGAGSGGGWMIGGSPRDFPYLKALMQASQDGDFAPDRPNQAPQEFRPSICSFRSILYRAGNRLGRDAVVYLERISDPDLRLFVQIELTAALAGLPEPQGTRRKCRPSPACAQTPS